MVFKKLRQKRTEAKAKRLGMTVPEYSQAKRELKRKEGQERVKFEKWKIEQKYKQQRKQVKQRKGKGPSVTAMLESLGGGFGSGGSDPLGLFGSKKTKKRKTTKRRKKK